MTCDKCEKKADKVTLVHIRTGKRGRPPKLNYCDDCISANKAGIIIPGQIRENSPIRNTSAVMPKIEGFHSCCLFLLEMTWENLFQRVGNDELSYSCKGCDQPVHRKERETHFQTHTAQLTQAA